MLQAARSAEQRAEHARAGLAGTAAHDGRKDWVHAEVAISEVAECLAERLDQHGAGGTEAGWKVGAVSGVLAGAQAAAHVQRPWLPAGLSDDDLHPQLPGGAEQVPVAKAAVASCEVMLWASGQAVACSPLLH